MNMFRGELTMKLRKKLFQISMLALAAVLVSGCELETISCGCLDQPVTFTGAPLAGTAPVYRGESSEFDALEKDCL
jgi:hypothetical protein